MAHRFIIYMLLFLALISCADKKNVVEVKDSKSEGFWFNNTYYGDKKIHTSTLLTKDTIPVKMISYRQNGTIECEFLFGRDRDSLGYGLAIHYDSSRLNRIENVEIVGINTSKIWKGYTLFYRQKEIMKIDPGTYNKWKAKLDLKDKKYSFDW